MSMTGYGEAVTIIESHEWRCVVQSVNSRNLDARFRFPSALSPLEVKFRKEVQKVIQRGKVDVTFSYSSLTKDADTLNSADYFNSDWVADFCRAGENLLDSLSWQSSDIIRASILRSAFSQRDAFSEAQVEIDNSVDFLIELLRNALEKHAKSRKQEGDQLALDMRTRLSLLDDYIALIAEKAESMPEIFKERINLRIETILADKLFELDQSRVTQEIAYLIDKADVSEEIVRFKSHIIQFLTEINDSLVDRKGKKLEFLVQEMLREINTIGSKANLLEITRCVLDVKNELEKIREQVQNIV